MMTYDERQAVRRRRFLDSLTAASQVIGLLGVGYEERRSFYKVFVRGRGGWWRFDSTGWASKCLEAPTADNDRARRLQLGELPGWRHIESVAIAELFARARELTWTSETLRLT